MINSLFDIINIILKGFSIAIAGYGLYLVIMQFIEENPATKKTAWITLVVGAFAFLLSDKITDFFVDYISSLI